MQHHSENSSHSLAVDFRLDFDSTGPKVMEQNKKRFQLMVLLFIGLNYQSIGGSSDSGQTFRTTAEAA